MRGYVVRTYSSQTISGMTAEEVNTLIARDIDEDAYRRQEERPVPYRGKKLAEGIQNVLYVCPRCHAFGTVHGKDDQVKCSCGLTATYTETGYLRSDECPFDTLEAWGQWQRDYLTELFHAHTGSAALCGRKPNDTAYFSGSPHAGSGLRHTNLWRERVELRGLPCGYARFTGVGDIR